MCQLCPITVSNRHHGTKGEYIGRGSPLGNPFVMGKDGTREEVISKFQNWIIEAIQKGNEEIIIELKRLHSLAQKTPINLICFCAPKACHGDIIKKILIGEL